jgi:hypothetical protein
MTEGVGTSLARAEGWMDWRRIDQGGPRGSARASHRLGTAGAGMVTLLTAAALLVGASDRAAAQPQANKFFWQDCTLSGPGEGTVLGVANPPGQREGLLGELADRGLGSNMGSDPVDPEVAFVIAYSLNNDNDGQPIGDGSAGYTGPVLCLDGDNFNRDEWDATDDTMPLSGDGNANFLDMEQVTIIRYQRIDTGAIEKVVCHSVDTNVDCVRISPK